MVEDLSYLAPFQATGFRFAGPGANLQDDRADDIGRRRKISGINGIFRLKENHGAADLTMEPLVSPDEFVGIEGVTHLCTGGEAPWLKRHEAVYAEFVRLKSGGAEGRRELLERVEACRRKMGQLWGVPAGRIGFMPSATEGLNWLARGIEWSPGDNVVTTALEFPSVAHAWRGLGARGIEVRMVGHRGWVVAEEDLLAAVDARTRVLAVSQVSFYTGQCLNVEQLSDGARSLGVLLALDATHAAGVVEVPAALTDLCVSSSYKWLLATHGLASCYLSERAEAQVKATCFGWHNLAAPGDGSAGRPSEVAVLPMPAKLEPGNTAMVVALFLEKSLDLILETGMERIEAHARALSARISADLEGLGHTVITPSAYGARSGNTSFLATDAGAVQDRLARQQVLVWGESGRVRVSGHLYNGGDDVDRFVEAMKKTG